MPLVVSPLVADVAAAAAKLAADDALITNDAVLLGDMEQLFASMTLLQGVVISRLREASQRDATVELCGRSARAWLVEEQLLAGAEAGRLVRLARQLPSAPVTQQALEAAEIGTAHASAVLTALNSLPSELRDTVEPQLVDRARTCPPEEIAAFTDELLDGLGLDKAGDVRRERRHATRGLDLARTLHGAWSINGTLTPEVGAKLDAALHAAGITPLPKGAITSGPFGEDDRTPRQRRHDALGQIADGYVAAQGQPPTNGAPRSVIVTMTLATLEGRIAEQSSGRLPDGISVSPDTARRLACDAALIPAVLGSAGEVLDIGTADHEFPVAVRRAAYLRDGGRCAFPQCRNRVRELHHIQFRRRGGPDSLDNAAWLCVFHHYLAHEGGWTLVRDADGNYLWTNPYGTTQLRRLGDDDP